MSNAARHATGAVVCIIALGLSTARLDGTGPDTGEAIRTGPVEPARAGTASEIQWYTRLDAARESALRTNRPMLLEFWAGWCAPCKYMDANVYTDARVAGAMEKVLPVRIDVDVETVLTRTYDVGSMPTIVFTDSRGNELFRYAGLLKVDQMLQLLEELPGDITRINRFAGALERDENDVAALEGLGRELSAAGLYRSSNAHLERAMRTREAGQRTDVRAPILLVIGRNHLALTAFEQAEKAFERALRDGRGMPAEPHAMLGLARALLGQDNADDARRVLQELSAKHPGSPAAAEGAKLPNR